MRRERLADSYRVQYFRAPFLSFGLRNCQRNQRRRRRYTRRTGVTILELLVALSVIAVLVSIIMPAVLRATEAARRIQCSGHLAELGKGFHAFHDSYRSLPPARNEFDAPAWPLMFSPFSRLLPYIDQLSVSKEINTAETGSGVYPLPPASSSNQRLLRLRLPVLSCPSDQARAGANNYRVCLGSDYYTVQRVGNQGMFWGRPNDAKGGDFAAAKDGLSQTALCSEKTIGDWSDAFFTPERDIFFVPVIPPGGVAVDVFVGICASGFNSSIPHGSYGGATWLFNGLVFTAYNHVLPPNSRLPDCAELDSVGGGTSGGIHTARSWHSGGVNVLMADGGVRFASNSIGLSVWRALGTRAGKEAFGQW